ncbi:replication endonuclease [Colwellia sp. KU-HH00111]|uniref:replication endonuclease n=1 Tax=Colwellia sp. KU-HH00111 TaxID=3127652 RepID=UPI0031050022
MDGGSIPPRSTKLSTDESQLNQAIGTGNSGCGFFAPDTQWVSDSPKWATEWHRFDTFLPSSTNNIGTRECYSFRKKIFERHPYLENALKSNYLKLYHQKNLREANLFIHNIDKSLVIHDLNLSFATPKIRSFCENMSRKCGLTVAEFGENKTSYQICSGIAKKYTIQVDAFDTDKPFIPTLNKLSCADWWFRKINKIRLQHVEQVHRKLSLVHKDASCYASNFALENRKTQLINSFDYLSANQIVNEDGQTYTLLDVYKNSVSNPRIRKAELMTRIRGFEEVATQMGHAGEFYTLTSPSKYHAYSNGKANPKFNGSTPKEVNDYFNNNWKLIRSALQKKNIHPYGFRVVEPHHDGTPHWHLLLFMHPDDVQTTRSIFSKYALQEDGNERGAKEHRFDMTSIDPKKGSAAGYIAKYISKNIDGSDLDDDLYGNDAKPAASKIDAWSSLWGIRQFQQIGGPSVTVWRELRRLQETEQPDVVRAFTAADAGDWAAYVMAMGGAILPRRNRPIHPYYETKINETVDIETGEIIQNNLTYYGDVKAPSLKGLINKNVINLTRTRLWKRITQPMTTCGSKYESGNKELVKLHPIPI